MCNWPTCECFHCHASLLQRKYVGNRPQISEKDVVSARNVAWRCVVPNQGGEPFEAGIVRTWALYLVRATTGSQWSDLKRRSHVEVFCYRLDKLYPSEGFVEAEMTRGKASKQGIVIIASGNDWCFDKTWSNLYSQGRSCSSDVLEQESDVTGEIELTVNKMPGFLRYAWQMVVLGRISRIE